ncbi:alpha/beta hydrolase-fold protein [Flammeovirga sp. SubArs3]|uniref:alpha/beta hydrolase n=1 Tax=Flammeovirga sp. SubArs3 TaxID=2995316 RepID=UPI00248C18D0|nr:alpha/beta hydrolase-fold protein [Flammeovirga sp. SubArs3]
MKRILLYLLVMVVGLSCSKPQKSQSEKKLGLGAADASKMPKLAAGKIDRIPDFQSKYIDSRSVDVYLPDGYSKENKYAVLYMHDGLMLFDSTVTWNKQEWMVDEHITNLLKEKKIEDVIVVAVPNNGKYRSSEYLPQEAISGLDDELLIKIKDKRLAGKMISNNYLKFLTSELKPYIDNNYSTYTDREHTFVMGSSMGGLISLYAICEYPEVFGGAGCLSTHWPMVYAEAFTADENKKITDGIINYTRTHLPDPKTHKIYFDYGTETLDSQYEPYQLRIDEVMKEKGFSSSNWITKKFEGQNHSERAWQSRLDIPLVFLLGK